MALRDTVPQYLHKPIDILLKEEQYRLWLSDPLALYGVENAKRAPGYRAPATSTTRK